MIKKKESTINFLDSSIHYYHQIELVADPLVVLFY